MKKWENAEIQEINISSTAAKGGIKGSNKWSNGKGPGKNLGDTTPPTADDYPSIDIS